MIYGILELIGSTLSFAGGVVLTVEALLVKKRLRQQRGAERLLEILKEVGGDKVIKDEQGRPLNTQSALQDWFAGLSLKWAWLGFMLMAMGFLLELLSNETLRGHS